MNQISNVKKELRQVPLDARRAALHKAQHLTAESEKTHVRALSAQEMVGRQINDKIKRLEELSGEIGLAKDERVSTISKVEETDAEYTSAFSRRAD